MESSFSQSSRSPSSWRSRLSPRRDAGRQRLDNSDPATAVTRTVEARILEVRRPDARRSRPGRAPARESAPREGRDPGAVQEDFDGLKKLDFGHLREGHRVKLTFYADSGQLVRIQVQKADKVG